MGSTRLKGKRCTPDPAPKAVVIQIGRPSSNLKCTVGLTPPLTVPHPSQGLVHLLQTPAVPRDILAPSGLAGQGSTLCPQCPLLDDCEAIHLLPFTEATPVSRASGGVAGRIPCVSLPWRILPLLWSGVVSSYQTSDSHGLA